MAAARQALIAAAEAAGRAPSIHNTQPWRWVVRGDVLELYANASRHLVELDPAGHLMLISCGTALHHVRVALRAEGWLPHVERPAAKPLARVTAHVSEVADPVAMRWLQATMIRHTDRRPVADRPVDASALADVVAAANDQDVPIHVLRPDQVLELAATVDRAMRAEETDERQRAELARWVGGSRPQRTGVPDTAIPVAAPQTTVPGRDFGVVGSLPVDERHDTTAVYAVLYGAGDADVDWLRAGEALSAAWLQAVDHGLTMLPISAPVEIASTRHLLRGLLSSVGHPYLVVRIGAADPDHAGPPTTPRLPAAQTVEVVD